MKRKPMKRERAYVVVDRRDGQRVSRIFGRRSEARVELREWGRCFRVQPVDIIPAKGRKG